MTISLYPPSGDMDILVPLATLTRKDAKNTNHKYSLACIVLHVSYVVTFIFFITLFTTCNIILGCTSALLHSQPLTDSQRCSHRCNTPCRRKAWPIPWFKTPGQGPLETHATGMKYGVSNTSCQRRTWPGQVFTVKMSNYVGESGKHGPLGDPSHCIRYWGTILVYWMLE